MNRSSARSLRTALAVLGATVAITLAPVTAGAATRTVQMGPNAYIPASVSVARGDKVKWHNGSPLDHDVRSTAPAKYFSSGRAGGIGIGENYSFTFRSAGRFAYHCTVHSGMNGSVTVPIAVSKLTGPVRFRVTLASASSSSPWRHQVQVKKPGASAYVTIATTTAASVTWTPPKHGTYVFRSRVTNTTTGADSGWSPTVSRSY